MYYFKITTYYNYLSLILHIQGKQPDPDKTNCNVCTSGEYKDNGAGHKTCQPCNDPGKVATQSQTKCELCPSVSTFYLPMNSYQVPTHS